MSEPVFFPHAQTIALVADSHRNSVMIEKAAPVLRCTDGIMLLGDCASDAKEFQRCTGKSVYAVRGNCDLPGAAPEEIYGRLFSANGPRFLACHGHRYGVKTNPLSLMYRAKELGVQAAFYGHTHIAAQETEEGVLLLNPGAFKEGRYALVYLENGRIQAALRSL